MKKKILFVLNHFQFSDGVAATLRSLVLNLNQDMYDIHILPLYKCDKEFCEPIKGLAKIHKGIGFYFRGLSAIISKIPLKWLYRIFVREKFDLEIAYQFGLSTKIISISSCANKICWMHTYDTPLILKNFYKKFPKIINVAKVGSEKLKNEGFFQSDYCYNIIDEEYIKNKATEKILEIPQNKNRKIVITVCRIEADKAILRQIECIERIQNIEKSYEFWIVGGGSEFLKAQKYVSDHNLSSYIKLLGPQNNPYKYLANADLYLCASLSEGFSTACQEAAILGIPVITTDVDGAQELIDLAECGCVIPNNKKDIINKLSDILTNNSLISSWQDTAKNTCYHFYKAARINKIEQVLADSIR